MKKFIIYLMMFFSFSLSGQKVILNLERYECEIEKTDVRLVDDKIVINIYFVDGRVDLLTIPDSDHVSVKLYEDRAVAEFGETSLKFISFDVIREGVEDILGWETTQTAEKYEVQYSNSARPSFITVGLLQGSEFNYLPMAGYNFYRVRVLDEEGDYVYSPTIVTYSERDAVRTQEVQDNADFFTIDGKMIDLSTGIPAGIYLVRYNNRIYKIIEQ